MVISTRDNPLAWQPSFVTGYQGWRVGNSSVWTRQYGYIWLVHDFLNSCESHHKGKRNPVQTRTNDNLLKRRNAI